MELRNSHRATLLAMLEVTKKEEQRAKESRDTVGLSDEEIDSFKIDHYLSIERVGLIKKALIENNIDY